jgi:hypothetical protein
MATVVIVPRETVHASPASPGFLFHVEQTFGNVKRLNAVRIGNAKRLNVVRWQCQAFGRLTLAIANRSNGPIFGPLTTFHVKHRRNISA